MKTPLVLLHGFLGGPRCFDRVLAALAGASTAREVICPTLSGHDPLLPVPFPQEDAPGSFAQELSRLASLIGARCRKPIDLVGYSMGGRLALGLAVEHPELVRNLTLISSRRGLDDEPSRLERLHADDAWARLLEERGLNTFLSQWWKQPLFSSLRRLPAPLFDAETARRSSLNPVGLAWALRHLGLGCQPSYATEVSSLAVPVTLMVGSLDTKFLALSTDLARHLPRARLVVVKDHGHSLLLEAPDAVGRAIAEEQQ